jgi:hypothetical protein
MYSASTRNIYQHKQRDHEQRGPTTGKSRFSTARSVTVPRRFQLNVFDERRRRRPW